MVMPIPILQKDMRDRDFLLGRYELTKDHIPYAYTLANQGGGHDTRISAKETDCRMPATDEGFTGTDEFSKASARL